MIRQNIIAPISGHDIRKIRVYRRASNPSKPLVKIASLDTFRIKIGQKVNVYSDFKDSKNMELIVTGKWDMRV